MVKDEKGHIRISFLFRQYMKRGCFHEEVGEVVIFPNYRCVYEHILLLFTKVVGVLIPPLFICSIFLTLNTECSQNLYNSAYGKIKNLIKF